MIQTLLNQNLIQTYDPTQMVGKYLAKHLTRKWNEDFLNDDTGEVVSVERSEIIFEKGTYIDSSNLPQIEFYMQCGEIDKVAVTDQCRQASIIENSTVTPWVITFIKDNKKIKILLFARSLSQAIEIACDYVELTFQGLWIIDQIKSFTNCIYIDTSKYKSKLKLETEEEEDIKSFYFVTGIQQSPVGAFEYAFLLHATNVDECKKYIDLYFSEKIKDMVLLSEEDDEHYFTIKSATITSIHKVISQEFTQAYLDAEKLSDNGNTQS